ncbi:MAG TPA: TRAP transporter substrate-binding protein DctP [Thermoanaerobaculia bacterium]|nr:TRAP transporter substrate-binding protein DctP [Thermoanaerobaculia bacterium]
MRFRSGPSITVLAVALSLAFAPGAVRAQTIKLATLAPQGSVWDTSLREMAARWAKETGGRVELRLYPGGVSGDEMDTVRKMRIGQFQGAALSVAGLAEIEPAFKLFHVPLLVDSWDELGHVLAGLRPDLERRLEERGYVLLLWGHGGWVHLFSRQPIRTIDDLKGQKMFVWAGDDATVQLWRRNGFQPVPLAATDVLIGLETGMIDVVPTTPIAALSLQWYRQTPYMQNLGLAPLVGAVVVSKKSWEKIPAPDREKLLAAARAAEQRLWAEIPKQDAEALEQMKQRGLNVVEVPEAARSAWREAADRFVGEVRTEDVPPAILAAARAAIAEFRANGGTAP